MGGRSIDQDVVEDYADEKEIKGMKRMARQDYKEKKRQKEGARKRKKSKLIDDH